MTVPTSPNQPPHLSPAGTRNHSRRGSTRASAFSPHMESQRTLCPRDGDAFSYDPAHLAEWFIPTELWDRLSPKLQATLAAMQHSGAAVLTGFERLEKQSEEFEDSEFIQKLREVEAIAKLDALPPPKLRTTSDASSAFFSDVASPIFTGTPNSGSTSPSVVDSQATSPVSPICLNPFDVHIAEKRERSHERPYSMPREPHDVYYAAELSHLRTEALTRLRHTALKVDQEWKDVKRSQVLGPNDIKDFDDWWSKKKATVRQLNEKCKRLSTAVGLSPGGMGWTYAP